MTKPVNIDGIEKETGKSWDEWVKFLDKLGARDMKHGEIAQVVFDSGVPGWWSQSVTVAYEQHIGRRKPGQRSDGTYEVSVSKTVEGDMGDAFAWWQDKVEGLKQFKGSELEAEPRTTITPVAYNWRADLQDGTKIIVSTSEKGSGKALFAVTNQKLKSAKEAEEWRSYWKKFLE